MMKKHRSWRCLVVAVVAVFAVAMVAGAALAADQPAAKPAAKPAAAKPAAAKPAPKPAAKPAPKPAAKPAAAASGDAASVVKDWFMAAAAGDIKKLESLSTDAALKNVKKSAGKKDAVAKLKFFGSCYKGASVDPKKKTAKVMLDANKLTAYFKQQADMKLKGIKDKKKHDQMKKFMDSLIPRLVKRMSVLKVKLAMVKNKWLVADISAQ
jgi:pyruvate/2-oxoglutarate dehydrogenase complex dihydrolipoamide acyltransferase (E2) component